MDTLSVTVRDMKRQITIRNGSELSIHNGSYKWSVTVRGMSRYGWAVTDDGVSVTARGSNRYGYLLPNRYGYQSMAKKFEDFQKV